MQGFREILAPNSMHPSLQREERGELPFFSRKAGFKGLSIAKES